MAFVDLTSTSLSFQSLPIPNNPTFKNLIDWPPFGKLTVLAYAGKEKKRHYWLCRCSCDGKIVKINGMELKAGQKSCGCLRAEAWHKVIFRHGHAPSGKKSKTYQTWRSMLVRCRNKNCKGYPLYGGRGITVCEQWLSFECFLQDMGEKPSGTSIDRIDNDKGYYPGNCRWATPKEQVRNRRVGRRITCDGETKLPCEWSDASGIPSSVIIKRIKCGWAPKIAIYAPLRETKLSRHHKAAVAEIP